MLLVQDMADVRVVWPRKRVRSRPTPIAGAAGELNQRARLICCVRLPHRPWSCWVIRQDKPGFSNLYNRHSAGRKASFPNFSAALGGLLVGFGGHAEELQERALELC